ncbi:MAG: hemolysin family protein [bacterium]
MDLSTTLILLSLPVFLLICGICSATETALFSMSFHDRQRLRRLSPAAARAVDQLLRRPREFLVTNLFINMISATVFFVLTSLALQQTDSTLIKVIIAATNLLAMTLMAEVVSKLLAGRLRVELCRVAARPLAVLFGALAPLRCFLDRIVIAPLTRLVLDVTAPGRAAPGQQSAQAAGAGSGFGRLTADELAGLLTIGQRQGAIDASEQRALAQVIRFGSLRLREVMTPRVDMVHLSDRATLQEIRDTVARTSLSRIPICAGEDGLDGELLGLLNAKRYLAAAAASPTASAPPLTPYLEPPRYVPETATLDKLLEQMRTGKVKIAVCVDEAGHVAGTVSTQDVVSRLVAEVSSGDPASQSDTRVEMIGLGVWQVPGRLSAREWAEMFHLKHDARVSTVAGLVMARLGRLPRLGDTIRIGNVLLTVAALDNKVVDSLHVRLADGPTFAASGATTNPAPPPSTTPGGAS